MQLGFVIVLFCALLISATSFHLPQYEIYGYDDASSLPGMNKRNFYNNRPFKREFNADDLTLRFGKRADTMAFSPDQLSLRFGK